MYKAMIIDDESIVRWGVRDLIDWEAEGFALCEDGRDGRDGLRKLLDELPDLVLVDIKMPGLSGIELIRAARQSGFTGHFIILTGYSEFEFAKAAISLGVEEYLLKPVEEEELLTCARKVRKALDCKRDEELARQDSETILRQELLRKILLHLDTKEALGRQMEQIGLSVEEGILCTAILTDRGDAGKDIQAQKDFLEKTQDFLKDSSLYYEKILLDDRIVLISQGKDYKTWAEELAKRSERLKATWGTGLLIAVGNNVGSWYELHFSYQFAKSMLEQEFLLGQYDVLSIHAIEEQQQKAENPPAEYILMLAEVGDIEGIREGVEKFKTYCIKNLMKETDVKVQVLYNLMTIKSAIEKKYGACDTDSAARIEQLSQAGQLEQLMELYTAILQDICLQLGKDGSDTVIRRMYYYMEKNYGQEMRLESFAKMFNYNANYLGKVFRKEIGDSFNNILDSIRITNAKRLLEETSMKVYQISQHVGYKNIDYFYLKFKKYVGISPKEYQKEVSQRQKSS